MFLLLFSYLSQLMLQGLDGDITLFILLYTAIAAIQMLKSDSFGRKSKQTLLVLMKFCYFCSGYK